MNGRGSIGQGSSSSASAKFSATPDTLQSSSYCAKNSPALSAASRHSGGADLPRLALDLLDLENCVELGLHFKGDGSRVGVVTVKLTWGVDRHRDSLVC